MTGQKISSLNTIVMKKIIISMVAMLAPLAAAFAQDVVGKWKLDDGSAIVEVYKQGDAFNGKIVWLQDPTEPDGSPAVDTNNPDAKLIPRITAIDDNVKALAGVSGSSLGTGGMVTKLRAAEICLDCGCDMIIANGNHPDYLYDILDGKSVGTIFTEKAYV